MNVYRFTIVVSGLTATSVFPEAISQPYGDFVAITFSRTASSVNLAVTTAMREVEAAGATIEWVEAAGEK